MLNKSTLLLLIILFSFQKTEAQVNFTIPSNPAAAGITNAEYFIDTDPGFGSATPITISSSTDASINNFSTDISSVSPGAHKLYIRTKDENGKWSLTNVQSFFKLFPDVIIPANPSAANITSLEYFFDTDPGFGNGTIIPITASDDITANNVLLNFGTLTPGVHRLFIRTQDASGKWSLVSYTTLFVASVAAQIPPNPTAANIVKMEYFLDTDPGFGNGNPITLTRGTDVSEANIAIDLTGLSDGVHRIYLRSQDANERWSETNLQAFNILKAEITIPSNPVAGNIAKLEYFFDTDPGFGNGTLVNITPTTDLSNYNFVTDISSLKNDTTHTLYIRALDGWSLTNTQSFIKGTALPLTWLSFNAKEISGRVLLEWATAQESNTDQFEIQRSIDGVHFSEIGLVEAAGNTLASHDYSFTDEHPLSENAYYRIRQTDRDSKSSYSAIIRIRTISPLTIVLNGNPVTNVLNLEVNGLPSDEIPLRILNASGKYYKTIFVHNGNNPINIQPLAAGMYFLFYKSGSHTVSIPFTKL